LSIFEKYADFYDDLYIDKDYCNETKYIRSLLDHYLGQYQSILDLGCGTGQHAVNLAQQGYQVYGVDQSQQMLGYAEKKKLAQHVNVQQRLKFRQADIRSMNLSRKFDAVLALFHVTSYLISQQDLHNYLDMVKNHLKDDGIFCFDFWYGPGVISEPPENRSKEVSVAGQIYKRIAEPIHDTENNCVKVNYRILDSDNTIVVSESHDMRYFFDEEIHDLLFSAGFSCLAIHNWLTLKSADEHSWHAVATAKIMDNN